MESLLGLKILPGGLMKSLFENNLSGLTPDVIVRILTASVRDWQLKIIF